MMHCSSAQLKFSNTLFLSNLQIKIYKNVIYNSIIY